MEKWKKIFNKILYPPIWLMILLTVVSAVILPIVFVKGWEESPVAYISYIIAFYSVMILSTFFAEVLPKRYKEIKQKVYDHPLGNKYMTDAAFKVRISLYISLAINLVYSVFKLVSGIYYSSLWIGAFAVYYILLSVIRFVLLHHMERKKDAGTIEEYRSYRISAVLMMFINMTLSGIVLNMIVQNKSAVYSDVFVITSAAYTFYILTVSLIDLVKYRKYKSPVMSAAKAIRFAQALVSLLSLEASMLVQFGEDEAYRRVMIALTGAGVCIIVMSMSIYMIVRSTKEMKTLL
ncbi:MAG: hypothetical protein IJ439_03280 [Tyzzerella sp.]|nr:hypothetical protein [Tyzzerella sp.]